MLDSYHTILLLFLVFGFYFLTYILVKIKKIKLITHRKIWNVILLITFLGSGLIGLLLALIIDQDWLVKYKWILNNYQKLLWIHVEFGIVMTIISSFHAIWHWRYYINLIKKKRK